jgi:ribosomal protein S30
MRVDDGAGMVVRKRTPEELAKGLRRKGPRAKGHGKKRRLVRRRLWPISLGRLHPARLCGPSYGSEIRAGRYRVDATRMPARLLELLYGEVGPVIGVRGESPLFTRRLEQKPSFRELRLCEEVPRNICEVWILDLAHRPIPPLAIDELHDHAPPRTVVASMMPANAVHSPCGPSRKYAAPVLWFFCRSASPTLQRYHIVR